jgi:hypothetical protein
MIQYVVRSPEALVEALDSFVDGARFKSRNQLINVILADWIAWERHPVNEWDIDHLEPGERADFVTRQKHQQLRAGLLGEELERYRQQRADVLDGEWQKMKQAESMALLQDQFDREQDLKARIRKEIGSDLRDTLKAELLAELRAELVEKPTTAGTTADQTKKKSKPKGGKK